MTQSDSPPEGKPAAQTESALTFPCTFPIKIMGRTQDGFAQAVCDVVRKHAADFDPAALEMRSSKEGNWLSVTATVNATSGTPGASGYRRTCAVTVAALKFPGIEMM